MAYTPNLGFPRIRIKREVKKLWSFIGAEKFTKVIESQAIQLQISH